MSDSFSLLKEFTTSIFCVVIDTNGLGKIKPRPIDHVPPAGIQLLVLLFGCQVDLSEIFHGIDEPSWSQEESWQS